MEELRRYVEKSNSISKDELLKNIPDIVDKIKSVGILNMASELALNFAEKIELKKLKKKIDAFKEDEIKDLVTRYLPFLIEFIISSLFSSKISSWIA